MADLIRKCSACSCAYASSLLVDGVCYSCGVAKGLNYMEKPHRFTPGPGGACLFCSHTQRWHTENRPKTPAEVEQEKKDRAIQEKNEDALASALMLTPLQSEQDKVQELLGEQKFQQQVEQLAGAPLQDPNDPLTAAGPITDPKAKAALKKALAKKLAEKMIKHAGPWTEEYQPGPHTGPGPKGKGGATKPASTPSTPSTTDDTSMRKMYSGVSLSSSEDRDLTNYTMRSVPTNRALRNGQDDPLVKSLDSIVAKKPLPAPVTTFRVVPSEVLKGLKEGDTFRDEAFLSTTVDEKRLGDITKSLSHLQGGNTVLEMRLPKGAKAAYLPALGARTDQAELLLARGSSFKIVKSSEGRLVVELIDSVAKAAAKTVDLGDFQDTKSNKKDSLLPNLGPDPEKKAGGLNEEERQKLADEGVAMEDGTFPIRNESDLKAALKLWGKATDPHETREHIIVRAYELDLVDSLPDNFKEYDKTREKKPDGDVTKAAYAITKSADPDRYSLGPVYIPNRLDAHKEFTTPETLQKSIWEYVRTGDRRIRLQHNPDVVAGECVEVLTWPHEVTTTLITPGQSVNKSSEVTLPAGTPYMGIIWEPWAWNRIQSGKLNGLSMGGVAKRVLVDLGTDPVVKSLAEQCDEAVEKFRRGKFNPSQPRDSKGRWTDRLGLMDGDNSSDAWSAREGRLPGQPIDFGGGSARVMVEPTKRTSSSPTAVEVPAPRGPEFEEKSSTLNPRTGKRTTVLEFHPENSDLTEHDNEADIRALANWLYRMSQNIGMSVDSLFGLRKSLGAEAFDAALLAIAKRKGFDPDQPRDRRGRWTDTGLGSAPSVPSAPSVTPLSDEEHEAHTARIRQIIHDHSMAGGSPVPLFSSNSTHILHRASKDAKGRTIYTPERRLQQLAVIRDILEDAEKRGIPREGKAWIAGGLPGAGKTSFLRKEDGQKIGIEQSGGKISNAIVINPDDMKTEMIKRGMAPEIDGLDPMETVGFLHEESSDMANLLAAAAGSRGFNIVFDITAHSPKSVADRMSLLQAAGYKNEDMTYFLVDVSIQHSLGSATKRHREGLERKRSGVDGHGPDEAAYMGGRYVPGEVITSYAIEGDNPKGYRSKMSATFEAVKAGYALTEEGQPVGTPGRMVLIDNEGYIGEIVDDVRTA